ncbi:hypothetical protein C8R43DRAFT_1118318 [Mycena crocata]|nr:hypothetical protein C8R43DRAFT_1118318 [Mycena crocata]
MRHTQAVARCIEQGKRLENLAWRLWPVQNPTINIDKTRFECGSKRLNQDSWNAAAFDLDSEHNPNTGGSSTCKQTSESSSVRSMVIEPQEGSASGAPGKDDILGDLGEFIRNFKFLDPGFFDAALNNNASAPMAPHNVPVLDFNSPLPVNTEEPELHSESADNSGDNSSDGDFVPVCRRTYCTRRPKKSSGGGACKLCYRQRKCPRLGVLHYTPCTGEGCKHPIRPKAVDILAECCNCRTGETEMWCRDHEGRNICKPCGQYPKLLHGSAHPILIKKNGVRKHPHHDSITNILTTSLGTTAHASPALGGRLSSELGDAEMLHVNKRQRLGAVDSASVPSSTSYGYTSNSLQFSTEILLSHFPNPHSVRRGLERGWGLAR